MAAESTRKASSASRAAVASTNVPYFPPWPPLSISDGVGGIWGTHVPHQACANGSQGPLSCNGLIPPPSDLIRFSGGIKYVKERSVWAACGVYGGRELTACFQTSRRTAYLAQESTTEDATKFAEKTVQRTPSGLEGRPKGRYFS